MPDTPRPAPKEAAGDPGRVIAPEGGPPSDNLPVQLTGLVGRTREIAEVKALLSEHRLLTLTGPGGSGKTRLALAAASDLASAITEDFGDGVWLVELASLSDADLVPGAVASVLGVRETPGVSLVEALRTRLGIRKVLLILDNCEHLVWSCARLVGALLGSCPNLRVLATSREALGVPGERLYPVPPLSLPDPRLPAAEGLARYEAARLFVERATAARRDFVLTEGNALAVAQICYRLEGMPLAIELAAARVRVLSAEQISSRLEGSFALLSGGRAALPHHRTIRATMDWSHGLLSEGERTLLRRLSVFAGGFSLEAAEIVAVGEAVTEDDVLELLASLVDKSLVGVAEQDGRARYRLLETVRQYASERLNEAGEEAQVRVRHAGFFLDLAERAEPGLKGHGQVEWLGRLEDENDNLRAAMRWLLDHREVETAARLAWALWLFWYLHGHQAEGYRYAGELLDETAAGLPTAERAKVLIVRGNMSYGREDAEGTERLFEDAVALSRQTGNGIDLAIALAGMGVTAMQRGDMRRATALFEEVLGLYREEANEWGVSYALVHLGMVPLSRGDYAGAGRYFEEALALSRKIGYRLSGYISLYGLALAAHARGDRERAAEQYAEGLTLAAEAGDRANAAYCLEGLAALMAAGDEPERAARLFGAAEMLLEEVGAPRYAHAQDHTLYEGAVGALRSRLGEGAFETAWADGRVMASERVVEYALEMPSEASETPNAHPAGLSAREVEVLRLVAKGMTNARIAEELYISPRTVNAHIGSVYHKIGSHSRAEAARFASEHGLL